MKVRMILNLKLVKTTRTATRKTKTKVRTTLNLNNHQGNDYEAIEHTPLHQTPPPEQGKALENSEVPRHDQEHAIQIPATPNAVRVRSILDQLDDFDDDDPAFIRDDGSTNFFLEHGRGIGDPANREETLEELEALIPDEQRALEEEKERRINAGQESIMDEDPRQGKHRDIAAPFLPKTDHP